MAVISVSTTFVDCEYEADLNLNFGSRIVAFTRDSGKYWKIINKTFIQTTLDGHLFFTQGITDAQMRANPQPVILYEGFWNNGVETMVDAAAILILAGNANRKKAVIQNNGNGNVRIGTIGVTASTGIRLPPGGIIILSPPYIERAAIYAIREGLVSSLVFTQETT